MGYLIGLVAAIVYGGGIWKFWKGFHRTNFEKSFGNQIILSILWPVLLIANKSYRKNFTKALKAGR
jgi:hypothetical protein